MARTIQAERKILAFPGSLNWEGFLFAWQNILNPNDNEIGVGYAAGGNLRYYWAQMFIKR